MPGNRTILRTRTMTIASSGIDSDEPPAVDEAAAASSGACVRDWLLSICKVTLVSSGQPTQADHQAAVVKHLLADLVASGRDGDAPFKPSIGNFEAADGTGKCFRRHGPLAFNQQCASLNASLYALRGDARKRNHNPVFPLRLDDVDRRFPRGDPGSCLLPRREKMPLQAIGLVQHFECLRPHPIARIANSHDCLS